MNKYKKILLDDSISDENKICLILEEFKKYIETNESDLIKLFLDIKKFLDDATLKLYSIREYKKDHIFDENKSVKWNRDRIKCANEHIKRKKHSLTKDLIYYKEIMREVIIRLYSDIYKISENKVAAVYDKYFDFDMLSESDNNMKESFKLLLDIANLN